MTTEIVPGKDLAAALERVIIGGDLSKLSAEDRMLYYRAVCRSLGLNELTQPFAYLNLKGRGLVLYAQKGATDQLRNVHGISLDKVEITYGEDLVIVTVVARSKDGRSDSDVGAVPLGRLQGEDRANAIMKAVTKAKRRVTLSLCGLGMLDETEVESIPGAVVEPAALRPSRDVVTRPDQGEQAGQLATPTTRGVEQAKADLKEACLRVGLPPPLTLREVNALAGQYGVDMVGSSAGVTAAWLERIRAALPDIPVGPLDQEHMTEQATVLEALRATCQALRRTEPQSLDELNALAAEAGMGLVASWDSVTVGWLEAIRGSVGGAPRTGGPSGASTHPHAVDRAEQALAGWIAAAADGATLEQLATDVARAHDAGTLTDKAAEALLEAVDARGAELDLYGPTELEADATASVSDREAQQREAVAHAAG